MGETEEKVFTYMKKASVPLLALTLLLHLISFGAPYWGRTNHQASRNDHIGLWKYCTHGMVVGGGYKEHCNDYIDIVQHDWQNVAQAFMTLALFGILATIGAFAAFAFVPDFQLNIKVFIACCATSLTTVLFVGIACAAFVDKYVDWFAKFDPAFNRNVATLGWAFYMAVVVGLMLIIAPFLVIPDTYYQLREEAKPAKDPRLPYGL